MPLDAAQRRELLALARDSVASALANGGFVSCPAERMRHDLLEPRSTFVTLRSGELLRGCCGTLEPCRPLAVDVWHNACVAAFNDPRFPPLSTQEWPGISLHVSVLEKPEPMLVADEQELLRRLRPFVDGLILECNGARATFLPAVWEQIQDPAVFVRQLKLKAGWPEEFWSPQVRVSHYTTESFGEA
jgi:uncharacterized protein